MCVCGFLWSGCGRSTSAAKPAAETALSSPLPVTVTPVRAQEVSRQIELVGTLEANDQVTVAAEIDGQIAAMEADLGDRVALSQVLARINEAEFRYAVDSAEGNLTQALARLGLKSMPPPQFDVNETSSVVRAKAELDEAQVNFKRMETLFDDKVISAQEFDAAETRYKTALATHQGAMEQAKAMVADAAIKAAQLAMARKKLQDTTIRAPLSGAISKRSVAAGEYVKVGAPLFTIVQENPLKLRGMVPEKFAPQIHPGQIVEARVDSFPDNSFRGKLVRVSPASDVSSRSFMVEGLVDNQERKLKPGFFAHGAVLTRIDPNALTIPQQALVTFAGVSKVYVIENDVARERIVQTGGKVGDNDVEIINGVQRGDLVAISGLTRLTNGAAVKVSGPVVPHSKQEGAHEPR
jgi:RND family efflux transporter MFP subunit